MRGVVTLPGRVLRRAELALRGDEVLGTLAQTLADIHGTRRLVDEADGGLRITYQQAAKRVARWSGGIAARIEPGDRVVIHTRNGYEQLLLCLAASRAMARLSAASSSVLPASATLRDSVSIARSRSGPRWTWRM